jgi:hypothetical protein
MSEFDLILVEHLVKDKEGWGKFFGKVMGEVKGKTLEVPRSEGNSCILTASMDDSNKAICIWRTRWDGSR